MRVWYANYARTVRKYQEPFLEPLVVGSNCLYEAEQERVENTASGRFSFQFLLEQEVESLLLGSARV